MATYKVYKQILSTKLNNPRWLTVEFPCITFLSPDRSRLPGEWMSATLQIDGKHHVDEDADKFTIGGSGKEYKAQRLAAFLITHPKVEANLELVTEWRPVQLSSHMGVRTH